MLGIKKNNPNAVVQVKPINKVKILPKSKYLWNQNTVLNNTKTKIKEIVTPILESFSKSLNSSCSIGTVPVSRILKFLSDG